MNPIVWHPWPESPDLLPVSIEIVRLDLDANIGRVEQLRAILSDDELARADRYKVERPRQHFVVCRAVLRQLLASCLKCDPLVIEFDYGAQGKPSLKQTRSPVPLLEFSVSHSGDQAMIALSIGRPVGVDLEQLDSSVRIHKLATRFFSTRESAELTRLPEVDQLAGFFRGWTCKEAYLKATGTGLSFPLNQFSVSLNPNVPAELLEVVDRPDELSRWKLIAVDAVPGFAAALMYEVVGQDEVTVRHWSW